MQHTDRRSTSQPRAAASGVLLVALITLIAAGCGEDETGPTPQGDPQTPRAEQTPAEPVEPAVERDELARRVKGFVERWTDREGVFLESYKKDFTTALDGLTWFKKLSTRAYEARKLSLLFSDGQNLRPAADELIAALEAVEDHGLDPAPYERDALHAQLKKVSEAQAAWSASAVAPVDARADELWKLMERLKGGLTLTLPDIESALAAADMDNSDLPLVAAAQARLDEMFAAKSELNDTLRDLDTALMVRLFRYIFDMRLARNIHPFDADANVGAGVERTADEIYLMYEGADVDDLKTFLASLEPQHPEYGELKAGLANYRKLAVEETFVALPKAAKRLKQRTSNTDVARLLQQRLAQEGYLEFEGEPDGVYGEALAEAVRLYQETHQLKQTGEMSRSTRLSLNKTYAQRALEIERGLQRHRESELHQGEWRFGEVPVQARVNIAGFTAVFFRDGVEARRHNVVVGNNIVGVDEQYGFKGYFNRTRMFSRLMATIVLNPTWRVPNRIKEEELDPKLIEEPDYYEKHNYEVVIRDDGTEEVVQGPGPKNALGLVKFLFPNKWSIYMHDTPKKRLFSKPIRAYSHGCMRTADALELARWILTELEGMEPARFDQIVDSRETYGIALKQKIPVTIDYNTVGIHESGRVMFFADIYKFDRDLEGGKTPYQQPRQGRMTQVVLVP